MSDEAAGYRALTIELANELALKSHEEICALRYQGINDKVAETNVKVDKLETLIHRAMVGVIALLITVLGWSVKQQIETNNAQRDAAAAKIELMQKQLEDNRASQRQMLLHQTPEMPS